MIVALTYLQVLKDVDVMDKVVYNAINKYYDVLEKIGYLSYDQVYKLLVLSFFYEFVTNDYRCSISIDDYQTIEKALNCLFGTTCLIPYPDYLKMGKLHLGDMSELACRVKTLEDTNVVKVIRDLSTISNPDSNSDVIVEEH